MSKYGEDVVRGGKSYMTPKPRIYEVKPLQDELEEEYREKLEDRYRENHGREPRDDQINVDAHIDSFRLEEDGPGYATVNVEDDHGIQHCEILYKFDDSGRTFSAEKPSEEEMDEIEEKLEVDSIRWNIDTGYSQDSW